MQIKILETENGKSPFNDWLLGLKDIKARALVRAKLARIQLGHMGDAKSLGDGVYELRIFYGPAYRVYFGIEENAIVILINGGDKGSQKRDIVKAKVLWSRYLYETKRLQR